MKAANPKKTKSTKNGTRRADAKAPAEVPAILLEGDTSSPPAESGPGRRYATPAQPSRDKEELELPEAYGTGKLLVTARDPRWIYAHWDLTRDQLREYNAASTDGHLILRIFKDEIGANMVSEIHVHPESRNWFVNVPSGGAKYLAELGYYHKPGEWKQVSVSGATVTPPDTLSEDTTVWFETLPVDLQFQELVRLVKKAVSENVPLLEAIQQLRASGFKGLPDAQAASSGKWTSEQERALAELVTMDSVR